MSQKSQHKAQQIQVRDLLKAQAEREALEVEYPNPDWWREDIHGATALASRVHLRSIGAINRPKRGARCGFKDWQKWREAQC